MKTKRLLLVDDHEDSLAMLTVILSERYVVCDCSSAAEALVNLDSFKPDLLVLDIAMSPVDGIQCLNVIRRKSRYRRIPAIALTALARDDEKQAFLSAGFHAVIAKPILDYLHLQQMIDALLESQAVLDPPVVRELETGGSEDVVRDRAS